LGGGEVSLLEMTQAYGVFANQGYRVDLHPVLSVVDRSGKTLEEYNPPSSAIFGKRVMPAGITFIISNILADNTARELEFGTNSELRIGKLPISVKTGTTNDFRDNWTIGYTTDRVVGVWVGNNDNTPMSGLVSGITGAAPIWHKLMQHLVEGKPVAAPSQPNTVIGKIVCATSGLLPQPDGDPNKCPTRYEFFIRGTEPTQVDPGRQRVKIDKATNDLAKPEQTDNVEDRDELVVTDIVGDKYCVSCPHPTPTPEEKKPN
jgi:membrane peptidoglycan carboxypeptidase